MLQGWNSQNLLKTNHQTSVLYIVQRGSANIETYYLITSKLFARGADMLFYN